MCGICGTVALDGRSREQELRKTSQAMLRAMAHRGPDGDDIVATRNVAIGANRLAIRSLNDSEPPLFINDQGVILACNGEIDNHHELRQWLEQRGHVLERHTDIAVMLPLYMELGAAFVERLRGVFALAIFDPRSESLLLSRDPSGERHLYFDAQEHAIRFATELAALRAGNTRPPALDTSTLELYLGAGYYPGTCAPFQGWSKVRPGESVQFQSGNMRRYAHWQCPLGVHRKLPARPSSFDDVFRGAVARQTDMDVDYGVLLSGGVDSSLLTAIARDLHPERDLTAYGIRFDETSYDEGEHAARVAQHLHCRFVPVTVAAQDFPATLKDLIHATGEPLADPAWIPLAQVAQRAARDVRVVLAGEGADELFGGYPSYLGARVADHYGKLPGGIRHWLNRRIEKLPVSDKKVTVSFLLKRFIQGQTLPGLARHMLWTANIQPDILQRLGVTNLREADSRSDMSLLDEVQRFDFRHALPEALLAKADRGGMRHALEIRAPFLDAQVIEFASRLPERQRVRGLSTKVFLKRYATKYLPRSVVYRRKRGLSVPLASWLRGPLHDWARMRLGSDALDASGIRASAALELLMEHRTHARDHARALWTLIVLSEWLEWAQGLQEGVMTEGETMVMDTRNTVQAETTSPLTS